MLTKSKLSLSSSALMARTQVRRRVHRFSLSRLLRPVNILPHGQNDQRKESETEKSHESRSLKLLEDQGIIRSVADSQGMYHYLPLAVRYIHAYFVVKNVGY